MREELCAVAWHEAPDKPSQAFDRDQSFITSPLYFFLLLGCTFFLSFELLNTIWLGALAPLSVAASVLTPQPSPYASMIC
jgi:hypothetical protein